MSIYCSVDALNLSGMSNLPVMISPSLDEARKELASGLEALRLAQRYRLGLAIVDVGLLDMTGFDLVRQLRSGAPELPVVVTTGDYRPTTEVEARQLGIVQYLHKPVNLERLDKVVVRVFPGDAEATSNTTVSYTAKLHA